MADPIEEEIKKEISDNKIVVYGKGTKERPMCGFTKETVEFFERYAYPYKVVDVLQNMPKRETLSRMTNWPTLPKVFIGGQFYGDTDILDPMAANGELVTLLKKVFEPAPVA